jgi:hypothetical protein
MPMTMDGEKILYECILCHRPFQFGPHVYNGRHIAAWGVQICDGCIKSNWDGIMPDRHPDLIEHLQAKGIPITLNPRGWLNIPPS